MLHNTTAVSVINHMGTNHNYNCNHIAVKIWTLCSQQQFWITACHIPGKCNVFADQASRYFINQDPEWMLNNEFLGKALSRLHFMPEIDLFASLINKQFETYCSLRPDPDAIAIDAFTLTWSSFKFYCFPPFSSILRGL